MAITAAEHLCAVLVSHGITHLFTVPGTQNIALLEGARRTALAVVVPTNENSAGFAAIGAAKATGRVAALSTIPGPGFTLALTALAEAYHDSVPLLFLSMSPHAYSDGRRGLQEIPQREMVRGLVKEIISIRRLEEIGEGITHAVHRSTLQEPGPVYIEIDSALFAEEFQGSSHPLPRVVERPRSTGPVAEVAERLERSPRTLFLVGGGAASGAEGLRLLLERAGGYALATCSGRGVISEEHPRSLRWDFGPYGASWANRLIKRASLVVVWGARLGHNGSAGFELEIPSEKMIRIDASPDVGSVGYSSSLSIVGDVAGVVTELLARVPVIQSEWGKEVESLQRSAPPLNVLAVPRLVTKEESVPVDQFFSSLGKCYPPDAILATDSGLHQILARAFWVVRHPRSFVVPTDFQAMGSGIPMAIGAAISSPRREVIAIVGDGGFLMTATELLIARKERLSLTVIVFNDGAYGLIRLQQLGAYGEATSTAVELPHLPQFAESIGATYFLVDGDLDGVLTRAAATPGVRIVEVRVADSDQLRKLAKRSRSRAKIRSVLKSTVLWRLVRMAKRSD